jgi:hypothetical protein
MFTYFIIYTFYFNALKFFYKKIILIGLKLRTNLILLYMKLFDYKFLILLALTLVVYFIFREVLDLRKKIDTLQTNINDLNNNKLIEDNNVYTDDNKESYKAAVFQIPLPKKVIVEEPSSNKDQCVVEIPNLIDDSHNASETEEVTNSNNEERLAIYSNDNHEDAVEEFSLDETSDIDTQDIINNLSDKESSVNSEENDSPKKKTLLVEIEGNDVNDNIVDNVDNIVDNTDNVNESKHTITTLMRLKLNELQCLAEENRIEITNSNKGRKKTKTELSKDLFDYFQIA